MSKLFDQTGDLNGQQLYRLTRLYPLPQFVKTAASKDIYGDDEQESHMFAYPALRQFPCHTAPATYISTLFFMDKQAEMDEDMAKVIENRLGDFAFYHGISESIDRLKQATINNRPGKLEDLSNDDFALLIDQGNGQVERHYPLRNALEVKKAAEYLHEYRDVIPYGYRQKIASRILTKADEYGAGLGDLDTFLQKQAGHGACSSDTVARLLFSRAKMLKRASKSDLAVAMGNMAKAVAQNPGVTLENEQLIKIATLVDKTDREAGLHRFVEDLKRPEDAFFVITEKAASQFRAEHVGTTSGNIYKLGDMENLKLADVRELMGDDFAEAISAGGLFISEEKIAEVLPTLPRPDAELFERLLSSAGIQPVAAERSKQATSFSPAQLVQLAAIRP